MQMYKLLLRDHLVKNSFVADDWDLKGFQPNDFLQGKAIRRWPAGICFRSSGPEMDGDPDDFIVNNAMVPLATQRLVNLIVSLRVPAVQMLDAQILFSSGRKQQAYVINFTQLVDGLDIRHSNVIYYPKDYPDAGKRLKLWTVVKASLLRRAVEPWDIFRCTSYPVHLFASAAFKRLFQSMKMTGATFHAVKMYD